MSLQPAKMCPCQNALQLLPTHERDLQRASASELDAVVKLSLNEPVVPLVPMEVRHMLLVHTPTWCGCPAAANLPVLVFQVLTLDVDERNQRHLHIAAGHKKMLKIPQYAHSLVGLPQLSPALILAGGTGAATGAWCTCGCTHHHHVLVHTGAFVVSVGITSHAQQKFVPHGRGGCQDAVLCCFVL